MPTLLVCSASTEQSALVALSDVVVKGPEGVLDLLRQLTTDARDAARLKFPCSLIDEQEAFSGTPSRRRKLSPHNSSFLESEHTVSVTRLPVLFVSDLVVLPGHGRAARARRVLPGRHRRRPRQQRRPAAGRAPPRGPLRVVRRGRDRRAGGRLAHPAGGSPAAVPQGRAPRPHRQRRHRPRRRPLGRGRAGRRPGHRPRPRARRGVQAARRRGAPAPRGLAGHRHRPPDDRPERHRRRRRLRAVPLRGPQARAAREPRRRVAARDPHRLDPRPPRRGRAHRQDRRGRPRGHGEEPARVPAAPAARRDPQGARRG